MKTSTKKYFGALALITLSSASLPAFAIFGIPGTPEIPGLPSNIPGVPKIPGLPTPPPIIPIPIPGSPIPFPVKPEDLSREAQNAAKTTVEGVARGVDQLFKEIDHFAKRNGKELALKGRVTACLTSGCLSEIYRDHELKKARAEAQREKEEMLKNFREKIVKDIRENNLTSLKQDRQALSEQLKKANELNAEYEDSINMLKMHMIVLEGETYMRGKLRSMKRAPSQPSKEAMNFAQQLSEIVSSSRPEAAAMEQFENKVAVRATQLGVNVEELNHEILKVISDKDLQNVISHVTAGIKAKVQLQATLAANTLVLQSQIDVADAAIKKLESGGK